MWANLSDTEKIRHLLETPVGIVPCDEKCDNCPIGTFSRCGDDIAYKRALSWIRKMKAEQTIDMNK